MAKAAKAAAQVAKDAAGNASKVAAGAAMEGVGMGAEYGTAPLDGQRPSGQARTNMAQEVSRGDDHQPDTMGLHGSNAALEGKAPDAGNVAAHQQMGKALGHERLTPDSQASLPMSERGHSRGHGKRSGLPPTADGHLQQELGYHDMGRTAPKAGVPKDVGMEVEYDFAPLDGQGPSGRTRPNVSQEVERGDDLQPDAIGLHGSNAALEGKAPDAGDVAAHQ